MTLPSFNAADLVELATQYFPGHRAYHRPSSIKHLLTCNCGEFFDSIIEHDRHVAELVVSAVTMELIGLAHDQQVGNEELTSEHPKQPYISCHRDGCYCTVCHGSGVISWAGGSTPCRCCRGTGGHFPEDNEERLKGSPCPPPN